MKNLPVFRTYVRTVNIPTPPALCLGTPVLRQKWYVSFAMRMHEFYGSRELYHDMLTIRTYL